MFTRPGKQLWEARTKKEGRAKESSRRKSPGRGAQGWAGSGGEVRGPRHESSFVAAAWGSPKFEGGVPERPLAEGVETLALRPSAPRPRPPARPRAGSHRVRCGGSVAGPERRQGDGGGRAGPHSAARGPRAEPRGSLELTHGAVPSSAWEPRGEETKEGQGGERHPDRAAAPHPCRQRTPLSPGRRGSRERASGVWGARVPNVPRGPGPGGCKVQSGPARARGPRRGRAGAVHVAGGRRPGGGWPADRAPPPRQPRGEAWLAPPGGSGAPLRGPRGPRATMSGAGEGAPTPGARLGADFGRGPGSGRRAPRVARAGARAGAGAGAGRAALLTGRVGGRSGGRGFPG